MYRVAFFEARMERGLAELIRRRGAEPLPFPLFREEALPLPLGELLAFRPEALVFTSARGVEVLFREAEAQGRLEALLSLLRGAQLYARGPKPKALLEARGLRPLVAPYPHTGEALLGILPAALGRVALLHPGLPDGALEEALRARGEVLPLHPYRLVLREEAVAKALEGLKEAEAALFTSPPQAEALLGEAEGLRRLKGLRLAAVGEATAKPLRARGLAPRVGRGRLKEAIDLLLPEPLEAEAVSPLDLLGREGVVRFPSREAAEALWTRAGPNLPLLLEAFGCSLVALAQGEAAAWLRAKGVRVAEALPQAYRLLGRRENPLV